MTLYRGNHAHKMEMQAMEPEQSFRWQGKGRPSRFLVLSTRWRRACHKKEQFQEE